MTKMKNIFFIVTIVFLQPLESAAQKAPLPANKHQFVVIAHRGDHNREPENTLAAYQKAIDDGADFIEIDLRTTKDSQLVIMHNENISDMTGYDAEVKELLFDSLRNIKVRERFNPEWGSYDIPTLNEVLQLCKGKINIYIDFEDAAVAETFKEILAAGMQDHVVVYIDEPHQFEAWGTIAPMMPLVMSLPGPVNTKAAIVQLLATFNIDILGGRYTKYNAEKVRTAAEKKVPVWGDAATETENSADWKSALAAGLTGLQTDHPGDLIKFLIARGIR